ncbi:MAG: DUF6797 domain-containing protein, partial [Schleiferiaceae bacterium]
MQKLLFRPLVLATAMAFPLLPLAAAEAKKDAKKADAKPAPKPKASSTQWDLMDLGPSFAGGLQVPGDKGEVFRPALKGLSLNLGNGAAVCFDTERLRLAIGWGGGFLKLPTGREGLEGVASPVGEIAFKSDVLPGWADASGKFVEPKPPLKDGRELVSYGPLPKEWAKWRGHYVHGKQVILSYTVGKVGVRSPRWIRARVGRSMCSTCLASLRLDSSRSCRAIRSRAPMVFSRSMPYLLGFCPRPTEVPPPVLRGPV